MLSIRPVGDEESESRPGALCVIAHVLELGHQLLPHLSSMTERNLQIALVGQEVAIVKD